MNIRFGFTSRLARAAMVLSIVLASACSGVPEGRDLFTVRGVITGMIGQASNPLPNATVTATALYPPPTGALRLTDSTSTGADGRYLLVFTTLNAPDTVLFAALSVRPPTGTGLPPRDTANIAVRITQILPPRDTTHVDVVY